jgi:hypothetical protein
MSEALPLQHSILGTFLLPVAQALRLHGVDPMELMAEVGIDVAKIANPDWRVPHDNFNLLMQRCVEESDDEAFGLLAGEADATAGIARSGLCMACQRYSL